MLAIRRVGDVLFRKRNKGKAARIARAGRFRVYCAKVAEQG